LPVIQDVCGKVISAPVPVISGTATATSCGGTVIYTYTYTDCSGLSKDWIYTYVIDDKNAPALTGTWPSNNTGNNVCLSRAPSGPSNAAIADLYTDVCGGTVGVTHTSVPSGDDCLWSVLYTYTVKDKCGNTVSPSPTYIVSGGDKTAPIITGTLGSESIQGCTIDAAPKPVTTASALMGLGSTESPVTISDNCTPLSDLIITSTDTTDGTCPIKIYRTYKVTDLCGNSTTITSTYIIEVNDFTPPVISNVPAAITYSCASEVPVAQVNSVTVTDNCLGQVTVTVTDNTIPGNCPNKLTISRVWTAKDICGNTSSATQVITVNDQINPTFQNFPADVSVSCSSAVPAANTSSVTATDNCTGNVTIAVDQDVISNQNCDNQYTIKRTYRATDLCGNVSSKTQTILVNDDIAPSISVIPADITVSCVSEIPVANTSSVTATDNCSGTVSITVYADVISNVICENKYTIKRTYTATDICGNTSSKTQTILVDDEIAPVISSIPADVTVSCASEAPVANTNSVTATDNCNGTVSITVSADQITDLLCANRYTISRTYWATDNCNNKSSKTQKITVYDQTPPVISGVPSSQTYSCISEVPEGQVTSVTAIDNCSEQVGVTVTDITTSGDCANNYTVTRIWTATDVCGNVASATQTIIVSDKTPPTITGVPATATYSCAAEVPGGNTASVTALDNCSGLVSVTVTDLKISGSCENKFTITRTWMATDACGNTATATQLITVSDQTQPTISGTISMTTISGCSVDNLPAPATSVEGLSVLGLTVTDGCSGSASLTVTSKDVASGSCPTVVLRTYSIADACGNMSTYTQTINVMDNTAPVISGTATITNVEGCTPAAAPAKITTVSGLASLGITVTDNCTSSASLTVTSSDVISGSCPIKVSRVYSVADACGNISTFTHTINISDSSAPVIAGKLTALIIEGCSAVSAPTPVTTVAALVNMGLTISDNCSATESLTVTSTQTSSGVCPVVISRTYRIADLCGNSSVATQVIEVGDRTAPEITGKLNVLNSEGCSATDASAPVTTVSDLEKMGVLISDMCTSDANLSVSSTETSTGTCPVVVTRIYTVTDACGNAATLNQVINVTDTTAPVAKGKNVTLSLTPQGTVSFNASDIDNGSSDNCSIKTLVASTTTFTCSDIGNHTVTLTVIDGCGNASTTTAVVTVIDPTPASLSINDTEVSEFAGSATLTVTLSSPRACPVSFTVNTLNNTAIAPDDYLTVTSTVYTIPGGSTTVTVLVPVVDDKIAEPTETFFVKLSSPSNAVISDDQGVVTIIDDDSPPTVYIGDASAKEGDKLYFPVTLSNISSDKITVTLGFDHVTTSDADFDTTPVTVTFPAGTISATAVVQTKNEHIQESNETFIVKVTGSTGPVGNTSDTGTGTIIDDDQTPIAVDDSWSTNEDVPLSNDVSLNDFPNNPSGNTWTVVNQPAHGSVAMNPNGTFVYTPTLDYNGSDNFTYKLCDQDGDCSSATVSITVIPVDDQPVANDDNVSFHIDDILNDTVADNDVLSGDGGNVFSVVAQPTNGTLVFNTDGSYTYTPNLNFVGVDKFTYKLCDGDGDCDEAVVKISIEDIISVNQILTPNGDSHNDTFIINGIQYYQKNTLTVFNRWGNIVYEKEGYQNEWDGTSNKSKVGSDALPVGTYFYVFKYGNNRHKTGYVYLDR